MKISEILNLTKEKTIAEIAKDHLEVGEKMTRQALKRAGCYAIVGQRGWFFDENDADPDNLDRSIYDFVEEIKRERKLLSYNAANVGTNSKNIYRKRHSFDLDVRLMKELKLQCVKEDKNMYEVVEKALRAYLDDQKVEDGQTS